MSTTPDTGTDPVVVTPTPVTPAPVVIASTDLGDFIESLQREVALPGQFATDYPDISEDALLGALADAFAEAQLDGWFGTFDLVPATAKVTPPISPAAGALIVIYAGIRWVRTEIRGLKTSSRYKAGPVEYEVSQSAGALTQLLKDLSARKDALIANAASGARITYILDSVYGREFSRMGEVHFAPIELPGQLSGITP